MTVADPTARPAIAERLSRLIQVPTVSAERESRGPEPFEQFISLLEELYPRTHTELTRERHAEFGLLYRWEGRTRADPVVLMAHFDVVPVDESDPWTYPPFEGRIADGSVYGRGALDDKGALVAVIEAVETLLAEGFTPARDVYLSFGSDEETAGSAALATADAVRDRGIVPWLVLDEGGAVVDAPLPGVRGRAAMVGVGEKGILTLALSTRGTGGHASAPPSVTAVRRIAAAVERLGPGTFRPRVPAAIRRMLALLSGQSHGLPRLGYRLLARMPWLAARIFAAMGGEPAALVRTTVAATMLSGGTAANVLPSQAAATVNLRIAIGETIESTKARVVRRIADPKIEVTELQADDPSPESPTDGAPFALIRDAVAAAYPDAVTVPYIMMQASDARSYHRFSPAVYRFAPFFMDAAQRASIHGVDERIDIDALERGELFHRTLIKGLE